MLSFEGSIGCNGAAAIDTRGQQREGLSIRDGIDGKYENDVAIRRVDEVAYAATAIRRPMSNMLNAPTPLSNVDGDDEMYGRFFDSSLSTLCPTRGIDLAGNIFANTPTYTWHRFGGK